MGIVKTLKRAAGGDNPGLVRDTFKNSNATTGDKLGIVLDPHSRINPEPPKSPERIMARSANKKKKKKTAMYANAAAYGYKPTQSMKKGGQVKAHKSGDNCRGMGSAIKGGRFNKDG